MCEGINFKFFSYSFFLKSYCSELLLLIKESIFSQMFNISSEYNKLANFKIWLCNFRELLIIGGVAARDQLSVLEQGVSSIFVYMI